MQGLFDAVQTIAWCGTLLGMTFLVFLSLPQSKLRGFLHPIIAWLIAICAAAYCILPADLLPEILLGPVGLVDDLVVAAVGVSAAAAALDSKPEKT